jgi:hypothetical protein
MKHSRTSLFYCSTLTKERAERKTSPQTNESDDVTVA